MIELGENWAHLPAASLELSVARFQRAELLVARTRATVAPPKICTGSLLAEGSTTDSKYTSYR